MYNEWRHWLSDNSDLPSLLTKEQETALISKFWELSRERASAKHLNADELALLAAVADLSREGVRATAVRVAEHIAGRTLNDHRPHGSEDSLLARGTPSKLSHLANDRDLLRYAGLEVGEKAQFELTPLGRKRLASRR
jgi:hypothetical protein